VLPPLQVGPSSAHAYGAVAILSSPLLAILSSFCRFRADPNPLPLSHLFDLQHQFRGSRGAKASNFCTPLDFFLFSI